MKDFKFKQVDLTFDLKMLPSYDQEYLRTLVFETIGQRSVKNSGRPFKQFYKHAKNFTLFNDDKLYGRIFRRICKYSFSFIKRKKVLVCMDIFKISLGFLKINYYIKLYV